MEGSSKDFRPLAREVLEEFGQLGRRMTPAMHNARRGENGVIHVLACSEQPLTPTQIGEMGHLSSARVANVLRSLEEKGLVTREHSQVDRRRVTVSLTEAGRRENEQHKREFDELASRFLAQLGEEDVQDILRLLRRVNQTIDQNRAAEAAAGSQDQRKGGQPHEDHQAL